MNINTTFNDWYLSIPLGKREILRDDKWRLAEAAFEAGKEIGRGPETKCGGCGKVHSKTPICLDCGEIPMLY